MPPFVPGSRGSVIAFLSIVATVIAAALVATFVASTRASQSVHEARRRTLRVALGGTVWLLATSAVVGSGAIAAQPFPRLPMVFATINIAALAAGLSPLGGLLARHLRLSELVAFQGFRFPLELVLHDWAAQGTIPTTMTWTGSNWDIVSGVTALVLAPLCGRWRAAAWIANAVGVALLVNVARVAMLSSPLPFAWGVDPPLQVGMHLPYALIATVCVAGAVAGHVMLTRRLLSGV